MSKLFSTPSREVVESSVVDCFRRYVNNQYSVSLPDPWALHEFSVTRPNDFYVAMARFSNLIIDYDPVKPVRIHLAVLLFLINMQLFDHTRPMNETRNLVNGKLNLAENLLLSHIHRRSTTQRAVVACSEAGFDVVLTYEELYQQVRRASHALTKLGVKEGDRVAAFAPNNAEAIVMMLATTAIGAVSQVALPRSSY
jgi:acetoacetyl-CoA synthetase